VFGSIRQLWPMNTFAENSRAVAHFPLAMVETGLLSFLNRLLRAMRRIPLTVGSVRSVQSHLINEMRRMEFLRPTAATLAGAV
jgi:hypothetical protein